MKQILPTIQENTKSKKKSLAILIDPDKFDKINFDEIESTALTKIDFIFIGGSLIIAKNIEEIVKKLKDKFQIPVIMFPGNAIHICGGLDGVLFLSLISGRNPDFLIGQQVIAAPMLKNSGVEVLPTGYMLIDGGAPTTANYMSHTSPIPNNKPDIAACTAMAGEMLGLQLIFMDAGSGASQAVNQKMIKTVKANINVPLIIGGGINTVQKAADAFNAGADMIVIGNLIEENTQLLNEIIAIKESF
ncbi:geranylgeranylglyceryl/heptaprenylglyceryl phosphate synthase [Emticicia sp. SJ17W-69]|uniref:geranylgeranylglyceryl/heptaprenylglyceryl phosphate synthase n=1 Tax=Emticicia sp. SJ17W-69 TaxID=3421657 RepID=UPI003EC004BC